MIRKKDALRTNVSPPFVLHISDSIPVRVPCPSCISTFHLYALPLCYLGSGSRGRRARHILGPMRFVRYIEGMNSVARVVRLTLWALPKMRTTATKTRWMSAPSVDLSQTKYSFRCQPLCICARPISRILHAFIPSVSSPKVETDPDV